jgi:hypothetical protein
LIEFPLYDAPTPLATITYPGCRQTFSDCSDYFNNGDNYGGDLWLPGRNPYDGNPVW